MSADSQPPAEHDIESSCTRKTRYDTEQLAKDVAVGCWRERRIWLRAYSCSFCGGWHLTKTNAAPMMKPGWRLPEQSKRGAKDRERRRRRGKRGRR